LCSSFPPDAGDFVFSSAGTTAAGSVLLLIHFATISRKRGETVGGEVPIDYDANGRPVSLFDFFVRADTTQHDTHVIEVEASSFRVLCRRHHPLLAGFVCLEPEG